MGKKKIVFYVFLALLIFSERSYTQDSRNLQFNFSNKEEITKWSEDGFGILGDTISMDIEGRKFFFLCVDYGNRNQIIFMSLGIKQEVYSGNKRKDITKEYKEWWRLFCTRNTYTAEYPQKINIKYDEERKEIIFISALNKVLMILPIESFVLYEE